MVKVRAKVGAHKTGKRSVKKITPADGQTKHNPLPNRTPSRAFFAALEAIAEGGKTYRGDGKKKLN